LVLLRPLALIAALCLAPSASAQTPEPASESIRLRYGWPIGLSAVVDVTRTREREAEGSQDRTESRARFRMTVEAHPEGRRVRHDAFELPDAAPERAPGQLQFDLRSFFPSFLVGRNGAFENVEPLADTRLELLRILRGLPLPGPDAERLLQPIVSRPRMLAASADHWRTLVWLWRDQGFTPGGVYDFQDAQVLPLFGGLPMPAVFHTALRRRVPCQPGGMDLDCVELEMTSEPTPEGEASMRAQLAARPDARVEGRPVRSARLETGILLVTEPSTLIPHQLTTLRIVSQTVEGLGLLRLVEQAAYEFHYDPGMAQAASLPDPMPDPMGTPPN
jgi:hypothetical protein